jgi:cyclic pyranopterin phosphate synthase
VAERKNARGKAAKRGKGAKAAKAVVTDPAQGMPSQEAAPSAAATPDDVAALPHLDGRGHARMVDVGAKPATHRVAVAEAFVRMKPETLELLQQGSLYKGDALAVARIAGIAATKRTADLIPLAHPIALTHAAVEVTVEPAENGVRIETRVETFAQTGVELEALVAATAASLAIYDMAKSRDRGMVIERVQLAMKSGGRSGMFHRGGENDSRD